jgi:alpha-beta hydrolase superfamily lysophospholipase
MDHHGHSRSDGRPRGYADKFDDYVVDVVVYVRHCRTECADDGGIIDARPPTSACAVFSTSCSRSPERRRRS